MLKRRARMIGTTTVRNVRAVNVVRQYRTITILIHNTQKQLNNLTKHNSKTLWRENWAQSRYHFQYFFKKAFFKAFLVLCPFLWFGNFVWCINSVRVVKYSGARLQILHLHDNTPLHYCRK